MLVERHRPAKQHHRGVQGVHDVDGPDRQVNRSLHNQAIGQCIPRLGLFGDDEGSDRFVVLNPCP